MTDETQLNFNKNISMSPENILKQPNESHCMFHHKCLPPFQNVNVATLTD